MVLSTALFILHPNNAYISASREGSPLLIPVFTPIFLPGIISSPLIHGCSFRYTHTCYCYSYYDYEPTTTTMTSTTNCNTTNCAACANNTCTEVYHRQIRDEPEERGILGKVKDTVEGAYEKVTGKVVLPLSPW